MTSAFGMQMPGRTFSGNGIGGGDYKYSFNGKEDDKSSGWFTQDYGFRNYDYRLGRFFSQDPLFRQYPELTPYQFASNRPIDGIDLDGLEHLKSDEARIEITYGGIMLKIQNFTPFSRSGWEDAVNNPKAWTFDENSEGQRDIGISKKIGSFSVITPQKPKEETETSKTVTQEKYFPTPVEMRKGTYNYKKRHIANNPPPGSSGVGGANSKTSKGVNYFTAIVDLYQWVKKDVGAVSWAYDMGQL